MGLAWNASHVGRGCKIWVPVGSPNLHLYFFATNCQFGIGSNYKIVVDTCSKTIEAIREILTNGSVEAIQNLHNVLVENADSDVKSRVQEFRNTIHQFLSK